MAFMVNQTLKTWAGQDPTRLQRLQQSTPVPVWRSEIRFNEHSSLVRDVDAPIRLEAGKVYVLAAIADDFSPVDVQFVTAQSRPERNFAVPGTDLLIPTQSARLTLRVFLRHRLTSHSLVKVQVVMALR